MVGQRANQQLGSEQVNSLVMGVTTSQTSEAAWNMDSEAPPLPPRAMRRADVAYEDIKQQLLNGHYPAGSPLPVEAIAEQLSMSRHPVMEAMKRLAGEGFVDIIPQVGCRVSAFSLQDIADHFRLFAAAEGLLCELAAQRRNDGEVDDLRDAVDAIDALVHGSTSDSAILERYRTLNRNVHDTIHAMARAPAVVQVARSLSDRADFYVSASAPELFGVDRIQTTQDEHKVILDRIGHADADGAGAAMVEHVQHFARRLQREIEAAAGA